MRITMVAKVSNPACSHVAEIRHLQAIKQLLGEPEHRGQRKAISTGGQKLWFRVDCVTHAGFFWVCETPLEIRL